MGMTVQRRKDSKFPSVIMHKVADIRGGVSVNVTELGGDYLRQGAVLSMPDAKGICHVVKTAVLVEEASATEVNLKVAKGHTFKVGDFVMAKEGAKAYAITKIVTTDKKLDTLTIGTTLGEKIAKGACIVEAKAQATTADSALKYQPFAIAGTGKPIIKGDNLDTDAWVMAVTKGNPLPACVESKLKGIINY